jgi:hypothetical protein
MTAAPFQRPLRISRSCVLALALAALFIVPAPAHAAAKGRSTSGAETSLKRIQRTVAIIDAEAKTPEGETAVVKRLSAQLRVSEEELRAKRDTWGLGYGEIAMAYGFAGASRTGKTPDDVVAMRSSGTAWTDIAKNLGVRVDAVAKRMRRHMGPKTPR